MDHNDFRYMQQGKPLFDLKNEEFSLLAPINQRGTKKERALLLLHGFSSSPAVYRRLIPQLKNYDALVCPVLPGHAENIASFAQIKASDWVLCAKQSCEALLNEYQKVDVLGLSLGGLLACQLSQIFSFNHLFLLAPALKLKLNVVLTIKLLKGLKNLGFRALRSNFGNLLNPSDAEITYRLLPISTSIELLTLIQHYQWVAPSCPTDLFLGTYDDTVASQEVEQLFTNLPNASIHWLTHSAHLLPLDNDLDQIIQCINQAR